MRTVINKNVEGNDVSDVLCVLCQLAGAVSADLDTTTDRATILLSVCRNFQEGYQTEVQTRTLETIN